MNLISHHAVDEEAAHLFVYRFKGGGAEIVTSVKIEVNDPRLARRFAQNILAEMAKEMQAGVLLDEPNDAVTDVSAVSPMAPAA